MATPLTLVFDRFRLDLGGERLLRGDEVIALRPKTFAVLRYLAERPGQLATKGELLDAVWGAGTAISDTVLKGCVRELREALGDDAHAPRYVETVHRRGYRFATSVHRAAGGEPRALLGAAVRPAAPAFVGREEELAQLHSWLRDVRNGAREVVFVTGEPGIGKTTLIEAFLAESAGDDLWIGRGQCIEAYGAGEAYMPVLEAMARLCRQPDGERCVAVLDRHAPSWLAQMPSLLGGADLEALQRRAAEGTRERMLREMGEALEVLSAERPLVLWLEDLHWCDVSTLDLLAMLGRRREAARLLLLGSYRPVDVVERGHPLRAVKQELALHDRCRELPLRLLTIEAVERFLAVRLSFAGEGPALGPLAGAIHERTEGNPLFMANVVSELRASGQLARVDGAWNVKQAAAHVATTVPEGLREMIEQQLDHLGAEEGRILEVASVAGPAFSAASVAAAGGDAVEDVEARCAALARQGRFLRAHGAAEWPDGTRTEDFGFAHALYHEVTYQRVPAAQRERLHCRIAEHVERAYGSRAGEVAAQLAVHFERGREKLRAVHYLREAADAAWQRHGHKEVVAHLTRRLELLEAVPETAETIALGLQTRAILLELGWLVGLDSETEGRLLAEARGLAARGGDPQALTQMLIDYSASRAFRGELALHRATIEEAAALRPAADPASRVAELLSIATAHHTSGDLHALARVAEESFAILRVDPRAGSNTYCRAPYAHMLMHQGRVFHYVGRLPDAERAYECASAEARAQGADDQLAWIVSERSWLEAFRGEAAAAMSSASQAMEIAQRNGSAFAIAYARRGVALALAAHARWGEAASMFEEDAGEIRGTGYESWPLADLAIIHLESGDLPRAKESAAQAIAAAERSGTRIPELEATLVIARVLARDAESGGGAMEQALARAADLIEQTGAHSRAPLVHLAWAEWARARGARVKQRKVLAKAQQMYRRMGAPLRAAAIVLDDVA
jgi:DNA-binding winged helix-turn-helix (wHTH) protein